MTPKEKNSSGVTLLTNRSAMLPWEETRCAQTCANRCGWIWSMQCPTFPGGAPRGGKVVISRGLLDG